MTKNAEKLAKIDEKVPKTLDKSAKTLYKYFVGDVWRRKSPVTITQCLGGESQ